MTVRTIQEIINGRPTSDGAGVNLLRIFGGRHLERFDPFLMLDEFGSDNADDYIAGFPAHPHRGFSTITYMLQGSFEHRDHMGNRGAVHDGGVQWMTAGRGVIHSEMPLQTEGKARGFQLWLNLPAKDKLTTPSYLNLEAEDLAVNQVGSLLVTAIAGSGTLNDQQVVSHNEVPNTKPRYWDIQNNSDTEQPVSIALPDGFTAMLYVVDGSTDKGQAQQLLRYSRDGALEFTLHQGSRVLLLAGHPLNEPIVQYGPFVMNSYDEIEQAIRDYQAGTLTN